MRVFSRALHAGDALISFALRPNYAGCCACPICICIRVVQGPLFLDPTRPAGPSDRWTTLICIHQNLNTLHQYSKNYIGFQSNNASITNFVFLHIKHFKFSNIPIFTIVFLFLLTLCLQDHLIHRFCPSHMSEHLWVKGPFLS